MADIPKKKSYGLVLKKSKGLDGKNGLDNLVKKQEEKRKLKAFDSSGSEGETEVPVKKPPLSITEFRQKKQTELEHEKAMAEDPTVFQYDEVYEEMTEKKNRKLESQNEADKKREPKYMNKLLKAAERRNLEYQAREDRKQQKERIKEGEIFDDKEVFVTGAYKKQMQELEEYQKEEERAALLEARMDVTKQNDLTSFYRKVLDDLTEPSVSIKQEPKDEIKTEPPDSPENQATEPPDSPEHQATEPVKKSTKEHKHRSLRKRHDSDEDAEMETERSPQKTKPSIYSDSSEDEAPRRRKSTEEPRRGGLQKKSGGLKETRNERQKRFFTPTPPSSPRNSPTPEKSQKTLKNSKSSSPPRKRSKDDDKTREKSRKRTDEDSTEDGGKSKKPKLEFGVKKTTPEERLAKIKALFARKNSEEQIADYRKRYFARKAEGLIVPPEKWELKKENKRKISNHEKDENGPEMKCLKLPRFGERIVGAFVVYRIRQPKRSRNRKWSEKHKVLDSDKWNVLLDNGEWVPRRRCLAVSN